MADSSFSGSQDAIFKAVFGLASTPSGSSASAGISGTGDFIVDSPGVKSPPVSDYSELIKWGGIALIAIAVIRAFKGR